MKKAASLFLATRPQFLPAIAVAVGLGASSAWHETGSFDAIAFSITMLAALCYHAGMNVLNDYFDSRNGADALNKNPLTPFAGGSRFIQNGILTPGETLGLGAVLIAAGSAAGIYLALTTSPLLLLIGLVGLASGYFYSAPPLFLAGRGLGEITVGLNFGLLTVIGSYLVQAGTITAYAAVVSLPLTFLIAAILYINEFPDYESDRDAGKRNLVVRLGPERAKGLLAPFFLAAYASIIFGVLSGVLPAVSLIALLTIPLAIPAVLVLNRNCRGGIALVPAIKAVIDAHLATGLLQIISNFF